MSSLFTNIHSDREKRESFIISIIVHIVLLLCFIIPIVKHLDPPKSYHSIAVNFTTDIGEPSFETNEKIGQAKKQEQKINRAAEKIAIESKIVEVKASVPAIERPEPKPPVEVRVAPVVESVTKQQVATTEVVAEKPKKEEKEEKVEKTSEIIKEVPPTIEVPSKPTDEEMVNEKRSAFGNLFSKGTNANSSQGNDETYTPSTSSIGDIVKGQGQVGDGFVGRKILRTPTITDKSNDKGIVAVKICVNGSGRVISSSFQQKGSTTTSSYLISLAKESVYEYVFSASDQTEQCGTITIEFKAI